MEKATLSYKVTKLYSTSAKCKVYVHVLSHTVPLTSNLTALTTARISLASTRTRTREYAHTRIAIVLEAMHDLRKIKLHVVTEMKKNSQAERVRMIHIFNSAMHKCLTHIAYVCTRMYICTHTRVCEHAHVCGFRVTHEWTHVDRQVVHERYCMT